ncbi:MAG: hypothetical protein A2742_01335 [Candidatus Yanofskybacteria bacterium RIFCSPHIGHO2_01_FULL_43_32]|nr:MAG: hypothetical protein A2742_01335 [Candidatus Yanofskybacteria bacterium RIFCSPHIGHO2_01_FULL_43_32]OGN24765.1 MAG: hypothetical protein A2923_03025 [Candidatus Yanofskybacteria bacterium RIFCSPLOWO2_01_FULL_43_46]
MSMSMLTALTGAGLCFAALLKPQSMWADYPILDSWLFNQQIKAVKSREHVFLAGVILAIAGLAGTIIGP